MTEKPESTAASAVDLLKMLHRDVELLKKNQAPTKQIIEELASITEVLMTYSVLLTGMLARADNSLKQSMISESQDFRALLKARGKINRHWDFLLDSLLDTPEHTETPDAKKKRHLQLVTSSWKDPTDPRNGQ